MVKVILQQAKKRGALNKKGSEVVIFAADSGLC
jgi:hypothetical protein